MLRQFYDKLASFGFTKEEMKIKFTYILKHISIDDFDDEKLIPNKLSLISNEFKVNISLLFDDYYSFIFSNYSRLILNYRATLKLTQKVLARNLNMSPVDVCKFEHKQKYPSRMQHKKIMEVLNAK